jgi:hypothetical protein
MSARNGDRARFQKNRKRRMRLRERLHKLAAEMGVQPLAPVPAVGKAAARR